MSGDPAGCSPTRFVITLDADTQLPREAARRLVGTLAHPLNRPRFDPERGRVVEGYGVLQPRVSFHLTAATQSRFAALLAGLGGHRPVLDGRLRRLPGPVRDRQLHRQGHLRRRRLRGRRRARLPREPHPQPRPDRGELRPLRPGHATSSCSTTSRPATTPTPAASTAGSAATGRSCPGSAAGCPRPTGRAAEPACRPWSAGRSSTTCAAAWSRPPWSLLLALGWTVLPGSPWLWTLAALAVPALPLLAARDRHAAGRRPQPVARGAETLAGQRARRGGAGAAVDRLPGRPGAAAGRRDRADAGPHVRHAAQPAGVGDRRGDRAAAGDRPGALRREHVAGAGAGGRAGGRWWRRSGPRPCGRRRPSSPPGSSRRSSPSGSAGPGPSSPTPLTDERAGRAAAGRPARPGASSRPSSATRTTGCRRTTSRRTPTGGSRTGPRRPTGAAPALDAGGPRPRLHRAPRPGRAAGEDLRHARPAGDAPGPLLQLVRHADAPAAAAGLRLDGRQRQPAGLPAGARRRACRRRPRSRSSAPRSCGGLADTLDLVADGDPEAGRPVALLAGRGARRPARLGRLAASAWTGR